MKKSTTPSGVSATTGFKPMTQMSKGHENGHTNIHATTARVSNRDGLDYPSFQGKVGCAPKGRK